MYIKRNSVLSESYKNLIFGFVAVAVILVGVILYFSASKALIEITPKPNSVATDFILDVSADGATVDSVNGFLYETEVEASIEGEATGSKATEGSSIGKVVIINKRAEDQTLIKTTRLQTQDGILLRLTDRVVVPANGSIETNVYADNPSAFTELQPTSFIIPGLAENLRDKVYAESKTVLKPAGGEQKAVAEVDLQKAKEKLLEVLYEKAIENFKNDEQRSDLVMLVVDKQIISEKAGAEIGTISENFSFDMKAKVVLLGLEQKSIIEKAGDNLKNALEKGLDLSSLQTDKFTYIVQSFNGNEKTAKVKVHVEGLAIIKSDNAIFDKEKLSGLSPKAVELYLSNFEQIDSVKVQLTPFWVSTVPKSPEHVDIIIMNAK
ncbi:MAG: hypothetical protein WCT18_00810 [Patescibacteria group bacterium]